MCVCAWAGCELVHIRNCKSDELFIQKAKMAISNILPCFHGFHDYCQRMSFTCNAHLVTFNAKFLPSGRHLDLESEDISSIQRVINKQILGLNVLKLCRLFTTYKCEIIHQPLPTNQRIPLRTETLLLCVTLLYIPLLMALGLRNLTELTR